jgi:neutral/alkaline ceramidase-like enzyme
MVEVGYGSGDITPDVGTPLSGFASRAGRPSLVVEDRLAAHAVAFRDGERTQVLVSLDLLGLDSALTRLCAEPVMKLVGRTSAVVIVCTHTHSGPPVLGLVGEADPAPEYIARLVSGIEQAAAIALSSLRPASMSIAAFDLVGLTQNRRLVLDDGQVVMQAEASRIVRRGPVDPAATVLAWHDESGKAICGAVHLACHPVSLTTQGISGDLAGQLARSVGASLGAPCLFLQGASGDVNPTVVSKGVPEMRAWVDDAMQLIGDLGTLSPVPFDGIDAADGEVALSFDQPPDRAAIIRSLDLLARAERGELPVEDADSLRRSIPEIAGLEPRSLEERAMVIHALRVEQEMERRVLASVDRPTADRVTHAQLIAWRLGDLYLAFGGFEAFAQTAKDLHRRLPELRMLQVSYLAPLLGYLPTATAKVDGGYEADVAWRYFGHPAGWTADAERHVRETWVTMLRSLRDQAAAGQPSRVAH